MGEFAVAGSVAGSPSVTCGQSFRGAGEMKRGAVGAAGRMRCERRSSAVVKIVWMTARLVGIRGFGPKFFGSAGSGDSAQQATAVLSSSGM